MPWPQFRKNKVNDVHTKDISCRKETGAGTCRGLLTDLPRGQCAVVHHVDLDENNDKRLRTLGICPGRRVWMVRRGDPMVVKVMGTRIGLAVELARGVTVEVGTETCDPSPVETESTDLPGAKP